MFEVGFTEIVLVFGNALLVLGPARLPKLAADIGRWAGRARAMARQLRTQLEQETHFDPLADSARPAAAPTIHSNTTQAIAAATGNLQAAPAAASPPDPVSVPQDAPATEPLAQEDALRAEKTVSDEPKPG